ncbi:DUF2059 domain-containing protein [Methylibium sp.]|uniref:DUF2059 domain-containing protein n=1 Tax=Methylibium sp. TaxID=2067992 RepID=UPI003D0D0E5F
MALQQASLDSAARSMVEGPALQFLSAAEPVLRNQVPAEKRAAVAKQLESEARKYADELNPVVRKRAQELAQSQMLPAVEEKYTEDDLRQLLAFYESPVYKKMQQIQSPIEQTLGRKLVADVQPTVEAKVKTLHATMAKILSAAPTPTPPGGASGPAGNGLQPQGAMKLGGPSATKP